MNNRFGFRYRWLTACLGVFVVVALLALEGCRKRPYIRIKALPLEIELDWSSPAVTGCEIPDRLKLYIFNSSDGSVEEHEIGRTGTTLNLEVGTYQILCANLTDSIEIFPSTFQSALVQAKPEPVITPPDYLYSPYTCFPPGWVYTSFADPVTVGAINVNTPNPQNAKVILPMARIVQVVDFTLRVTGMTDPIKSIAGSLDQLASQVSLPAQQIISGHPTTSCFVLTSQSNGTHTGRIIIFGSEVLSNPSAINTIALNIELSSGRILTATHNVTSHMQTGNVTVDVHIQADIDVQYSAGFTTAVIDWKDGTSENLIGR